MPNLIESLRNDFINHPVKISRRKVLKKVVLGITGLVVESVLSGCTSSNQIETKIEIPDGKGGVGVAETLRLEPIDEKLIKRMVIQDIWDPKSKPFVAPFGAIH